MLVNYIKYKGYLNFGMGLAGIESPQGSRQLTTFNDEADISPWAYESVKMVQAAGIISGKEGNVFVPQGMATRAEVARIFNNYINAYMEHILNEEPH